MPKVYVIDDSAPTHLQQDGIQTRCCLRNNGNLQKLNKIELEGVIAHELSHIKI